MGCATCGGGRSRSGMGARAVLRNRITNRYLKRPSMSDPQVVNVAPTPSGVVIPPNDMSENPATGVIPPQQLGETAPKFDTVVDIPGTEVKGE